MTIQAGRAEVRTVASAARSRIDLRMGDGSWFTMLSLDGDAAAVVDAWRRQMLAALDGPLAWTALDATAGLWTLTAMPQASCATWQVNVSDRPLRTACVALGQCDINAPHHVYHGERNKPQALADARVAAVDAARAWVELTVAALEAGLA